MPLRRKVVKVGRSLAVILPSDWVEYHRQRGVEPREVDITVDDALTIRLADTPPDGENASGEEED